MQKQADPMINKSEAKSKKKKRKKEEAIMNKRKQVHILNENE